MNSEKTITLLLRIRLVSLPLAVLLLGWLLWAAFGNFYTVRPYVSPRLSVMKGGLDQKTRRPLSDYLSTTRQREMFRPGVFYATRAETVVNVLDGLVFLGIVDNGGEIRAYIQDTKAQTTTIYSKGQFVRDAIIEEIANDRVALKHGEATLILVK